VRSGWINRRLNKVNEVIWDANDLLNENKGYVKQSDFTATWHVLSVFMQFPLNASALSKSHLNRRLLCKHCFRRDGPVSYGIIKSFSKCKKSQAVLKNTVYNEITGYFQSKKPSEGPLQVPLGVTSLKFPVTEEQTDLILETEGDPILLLRSLPRPSFCYTHTHTHTHTRALRVCDSG